MSSRRRQPTRSTAAPAPSASGAVRSASGPAPNASKAVRSVAGPAPSASGPVRSASGVGVSGLGVLERGAVIEIQRARLLAAAGQVACSCGAADTTVARIVECAGVSRRTFYEIFVDGEDCLLAAMQAAFERACERVLPVWGSPGSWRERVRGSLVALLCLFDEEPVVAHLLVVEALAAGRGVLERRASVLEGLAGAVGEGAREARPGADLTQIGAEGVVGGVLAVLHARISQGASGDLVQLTGPLMSMLVLPYRGAAAARRELRLPVPVPSSPHESDSLPEVDPFKAAGMRLTYRTMRVLETIAEHPGSSNRQVAMRAEVSDQGQISKLLGRLERVGMVSNDGGAHLRGEPNAWTLTPAGEQVTRSIRLHTPSAGRSLPPAEDLKRSGESKR
jgi:AcrR family transcriptional regulator/DNA-binding MarR family transcriptional regulator